MRNHSRTRRPVVATRGWALLLCCSLVLPAEAVAQPEGGRQVEVVVATANVRAAASPTATIAFRLAKGAVATLIETQGSWYLIEDASGRRGYVSRTVVQLRPGPAAAAVDAPAPPPPGDAAVEIDHEPVGCIVAEQYPKLDACLAPDANVGRGYVHFRALGTEPWYAVELKRDGACYSTLLPKPKRTTREIQYYVDVVDRALTERQHPDTAPDGAYRVRVVGKEGDCDNLGKVAMRLARAAGPITLTIARDAGGKILDSAAAGLMANGVALAGFRTEGVVMAATGAAPGTATASASATGATSGAGGGGIGVGTIALVGGVVAAGAIALAAKGGGGGGGGGGTPTTQPPTTSPPGPQPGTGDIAFRLTWSTTADLDLYVQEPNGTVLYYANPASSSGGRLDVDSNAGCTNTRTNPVENVFWQSGQAPRGNYIYWVHHFGCGPASTFTLQVLRGTAVAASQSGSLNPDAQSTRFAFQY